MAPIQIDIRVEESAISAPANRFGIIGRLLRTIFRIKAPQKVEEAKQVPMEIRLVENVPVRLRELGFSTSERHNAGICTFEVVYTKENEHTRLDFVTHTIHGEYGGRYSQVILNVRADLGK
jgi:hypothetical protein